MVKLNEYSNFNELSDAVVTKWLAITQQTPVEKRFSFALAGGTTPEPIYRRFDELFAQAHPHPIQIVATDERWVPDSDPQSNEGLFQRCFNKSMSVSPLPLHLVTLKNRQDNPSEAQTAVNMYLQTCLPNAFNAVILGMGTDGHIASLFPNAPQNLTENNTINCVPALHPQTGQARMSLSLSRLLNTQAIWLVITGTEKRNVLESASAETPIGALLAKARCDVEVFWCK